MQMKKALPILLFFVTVSITAQQNFRIFPLPFNTADASEMAPFIYKNGIIFSSDKKNSVLVVTTDFNNNYPYNLYFVEKNGNKWGKPSLLSPALTSRLNESSGAFSSDFSSLYITQSHMASAKISQIQKADTIRNGIFECTQVGNDWNVSEAFYFNDADYDVAFPCISADGKYLFFSSKAPGGEGGFDIYVSEKRGVSWSDPENLGPEINTPFNEVFPFYHENGRLFFSTRGHNTQGRLDIFYTEKRNNKWIKPINLPKPFNSRYDDFGYVLAPKMDTGYFSSNRQGSDDIFMFASAFPAFNDCPLQQDEFYCYYFSETGSLDLDTTSLKYEWDFGDGFKERATEADHCYEGIGTYSVSLNVIDTLTGEIYFSQASYDLLIEPLEQPYITSADTVRVNERFKLDGKLSEIRSFIPKDYYWDFGDGNIEIGLETYHSYSNAGEYYIRLGITDGAGDTDTEENTQSGKACAQKRIVVLE
jgi:hypothetical protein